MTIYVLTLEGHGEGYAVVLSLSAEAAIEVMESFTDAPGWSVVATRKVGVALLHNTDIVFSVVL